VRPARDAADRSHDARPGVLGAPPAARRLLLPVPAGTVCGRQAADAVYRPLGARQHEPARRALRPRRAPSGAVTHFAFLGTSGAIPSRVAHTPSPLFVRPDVSARVAGSPR